MDRILTGLTIGAALYVWAAIACAGLDTSLGPLRIKTLKLVNPGMIFVLLAFLRALCARSPEAGEQDFGILPGLRSGPRSLPRASASPCGAGAPPADERRSGSRALLVVWLVVIAPVAALAWSRALDGGFIREDFQRLVLVRGGAPFNGAVWADAGFQTYWSRQVSLALDALTYPLFGLDPRPWHALNLGLHLLVALGTGWLALDLTRRTATAVLAAALVSLAPAAVEPVCWMAARDDTLAALFAVLSALALVRAVRAPDRGVGWTAASVAASLLALFCKESALSLTGALVPLAWLAAPREHCPRDNTARAEVRGLARAVLRVVPHALVLLAYVAVRSQRLAAQGWQPGETFNDWQKVLLWPLSPLGPLGFPVNMVELAELAWWARALAGAGLVAGLALALARFRTLAERETLAFYAFLLLATVPVYRMIHLSATLQNNRYLYMPGVAWALLLSQLMVRNASAWPRARLVPLAFLGACFALVRMNVEPWVAMGAVASRLRTDLKVLVEPLARHERVRLDGLPDQWRGAFLFNLADVSGPLEVFHAMPTVHRFRLVELYHENAPRPPRAPGEPEFRWQPDQGLVEVPELESENTRSRRAASTKAELAKGSATTR